MAQFHLAKEQHRLAAPLSRRIADLRSRVGDKLTCGTAFAPEEMEAFVENLTDLTRSARELEEENRRRHVNDDVAPSMEALYELEEAARAARRLISPRINELVLDPTGEIADQIRKAAAALLKTAKIVRPQATS